MACALKRVHSMNAEPATVPGRRTLTEGLPPAERSEPEVSSPGSPLPPNKLFGAIGDNDHDQ